jgi:F-type H+-transporting ATPase subunit b
MPVASSPLIELVPGLMVWTLIAFAITYFVLAKFAFKPIQSIIDERRERIRRSIEEADNAREEAHRLIEEHRALIAQARADAEEILAEARKTREAMERRVREETEADRQRRLEETRKQIETETQKAIVQIRAEVAELTLVATAKVTGKVLDQADHRRLIDEALSDLDFSLLEKQG